MDCKLKSVRNGSVELLVAGTDVKLNLCRNESKLIVDDNGDESGVWFRCDEVEKVVEKLATDRKETIDFIKMLSRTHFYTQIKYMRLLVESKVDFDKFKKHLNSCFKALKTRSENIGKMEDIIQKQFMSSRNDNWRKIFFDDKYVILTDNRGDCNRVLDLSDNTFWEVKRRNLLRYFEKGKMEFHHQYTEYEYHISSYIDYMLESKVLPKDIENRLEKIKIINAI